MEVLAQLKAVEKAKGKIRAQVASRRNEAQEAKQLADAKRRCNTLNFAKYKNKLNGMIG
jgi:hypothetical protein